MRRNDDSPGRAAAAPRSARLLLLLRVAVDVARRLCTAALRCSPCCGWEQDAPLRLTTASPINSPHLWTPTPFARSLRIVRLAVSYLTVSHQQDASWPLHSSLSPFQAILHSLPCAVPEFPHQQGTSPPPLRSMMQRAQTRNKRVGDEALALIQFWG